MIEGKLQFDTHLNKQKQAKNTEKVNGLVVSQVITKVCNLPQPPSKSANTFSNTDKPVREYSSPLANLYGHGDQQPLDFSTLPDRSIRCHICKISCSGTTSFQSHISGKKHKKNLQFLSPKIPHHKPVIRDTKSDDTCKPQTDADSLDLKKYLGHEYMKEVTKKNQKAVAYRCTICERQMETSTIRSHMVGRKHLANYKLKVDKSIEVRPKSLKRTLKKMNDKQQKQQDKEEFWKQKDEHMMTRTGNKNKTRKQSFHSPDIQTTEVEDSIILNEDDDDYYLFKKWKMIAMESTALQCLLWFCSCCESALKKVSDEFLSRDGHDLTNDSQRILRGSMRVGVLNSRQFLSTDKHFQLVLLFSSKPTVTILQEIHRLFPTHLGSIINEDPSKSKTVFNVVKKADDACLVVKMAHPFSFEFTISLTSSRYENDEMTDVRDEHDTLSRESCIESLKMLMRSDWFQLKAGYQIEGLMVLRIIRHLRSEHKIWSLISEWTNELLIERCVSNMQSLNDQSKKLKISEIFKCYMEAMASGELFDNSIMHDPCENKPITDFKDMSDQEREDIISSAQQYLRLQASNKHKEFFDPPKISTKKRKSRWDSESPLTKKLKL